MFSIFDFFCPFLSILFSLDKNQEILKPGEIIIVFGILKYLNSLLTYEDHSSFINVYIYKLYI